MFWVVLFLVAFGLLYLLARVKLSFQVWMGVLAASVIILMMAGLYDLIGIVLMLLVAAAFIFFGNGEIRRSWISKPLLAYMQEALPPMSQTEREAIEAGSVWWDAELFRGDPDWNKLLHTPAPRLSEEEQAFLDGPVEELCAMLDDWEINHVRRDLPPQAWDFIKSKGFFGMIIPKAYGGLEFSAYAHSQVIQKIASRSGTAAVTVMVPNSLGPAELLLNYGTEEQKNHYLPRLARGEEIPCFALTGPYAGSDAGAIPDTGIVCRREFEGKEVVGLLLNWEKRYITLGPVATVLGLAFHAYDPEHLLGDVEDLGITCALIPTNLPGIEIGRRHDPLNIAFMNGPNWGKDVFIPLDMVIGGQEMIGHGWRMLMERLSVGRGISLPSLSTAAGKVSADLTGAYARLRKQFHLPIGRFEGVAEAMGRIGGTTWMMDAARMLTTSALDRGEKPAVVTAIAKRYLTESMRQVVNDAMDVHGGKGICLGPSNYLGRTYQSIPVAITVEGANILTRSMIIFGQGAMRCHPYLQEEIEAASMEDSSEALRRFDRALTAHLGYTMANAGRSLLYGLTVSLLAPSPVSGPASRYFRQLARFSAATSVLADLSLLILGGALKRKESISGRFADALGYMYLCSAVLKRFEDGGQRPDELPLVQWSCETALYQVQQALDGIIRNFPSTPAAWLMRLLALPLGRRLQPPGDRLGKKVAAILMEPSGVRSRLVDGIYASEDPEDNAGRIRHAWQLTLRAEPVEKSLRDQGERWQPPETYGDWVGRMVSEKKISGEEGDLLLQARAAVYKAISVDDFPADEWQPGTSASKPAAKRTTGTRKRSSSPRKKTTGAKAAKKKTP